MSNSRKIMYFENMHQNSNKTKAWPLIGFTGLVLGFGLLSFGLTSCSSSETNTAGGGPSGTEAGNAIVATIYNEDGSPARLAKVTLVESKTLDTERKAYTTRTDTNGFVALDSIAEGDYIMEASLEGKAIQIDVSVTGIDDSVKLGEQTLQKSVYLDGNLSDYGCKDCDSADGTLKFYGLNHSTNVHNGAFSIGGLPSGNLNFAFIPQGGTYNDAINFPTFKAKAGDSIVTRYETPKDTTPKETTPKETDKKDSVKKDTDRKDSVKKDPVVEPVFVDTTGPVETILLEDFKDGNNKHLLAKDSSYESGCNWYMTYTGYVYITPQVTEQNFYNPFLAVIEDTEDGHQVHFSLQFADSTYNYMRWNPNPWDNDYKISAWANITVQINRPYVPYSIAGVDSIAFEMWGKGNAILQIANESSRDPIIASKRFDLPAEKKRTVIALADIMPENSDKMASAITWAFDEDAEVFLGRVELIGRGISNIWKE